MYVQPYFPELQPTPGNVAAESYDCRLRFVRRTSWAFFFVSLVPIGLAALGPVIGSWATHAWISVICLGVLTAFRRWFEYNAVATAYEAATFLVLLVSLGLLLRCVSPTGDAAVALGFPLAFATLYTAMCGRDHSFLGEFGLAGAGTVAAIFAIDYLAPRSASDAGLTIACAITFLFYYVYDLASLQQRRRPNEWWKAAIDLYRDCLNFLTYGVRVIHHWRNFKI